LIGKRGATALGFALLLKHYSRAAINAVHSDAVDPASTRWDEVVALYDQLAAFDPGPVVALNRAVAVAELDGPSVALALVDPIARELDDYHVFRAVRGELLARLGRADEALDAFTTAADRERDREGVHLPSHQRLALSARTGVM